MQDFSQVCTNFVNFNKIFEIFKDFNVGYICWIFPPKRNFWLRNFSLLTNFQLVPPWIRCLLHFFLQYNNTIISFIYCTLYVLMYTDVQVYIYIYIYNVLYIHRSQLFTEWWGGGCLPESPACQPLSLAAARCKIINWSINTLRKVTDNYYNFN